MGKAWAAAVVVVVLGLGVLGWVWLYSGATDPLAGARTEPVTTPAPGPGDGPVDGPGDGPPNHADNRGHLQPADLTDQQERLLAEEAARMEPVLAALPGMDRLSPDAVRAALVGLGYPADGISTELRVDRVVVGVSLGDGCVSGGVWAGEVRLLPMGRIAEWGCLPPDTH